MMKIEIDGKTAREIRMQLQDLLGIFEDTIDTETESPVSEPSDPVETVTTPVASPRRGRGRPPGAKNKKTEVVEPAKVEDAKVEPAKIEQPKSQFISVPCCDEHARTIPPGHEAVYGQGCKQCDEAIAKAMKPVETPSTVDAAAVKAKMREWILAAAVTPDALTTWILSYGGPDVASINPEKYPTMIADLTAKIGTKKGPLD